MAHFNQKSTSGSLVPNALPGFLTMYFDQNNRISFKDRFGNITVDADIVNTSSSFAQRSRTLGLAGLDDRAFVKTGSINAQQAITGSLTITQNLRVLGSASFVYITGSQVLINQNTLTVFGNGIGLPTAGYIAADSSSTYPSSSLLYNLVEGNWSIDNGSGSLIATTSFATKVKDYTTTIFTASNTWSINHNLDLLQPYVVVYRNNRMIQPDEITIINSSSLRIEFTQALTGSVRVF